MPDYLCIWSTHAFSTWAGPAAILISQSRVDITFAFLPRSSKPWGFPIDMCTHFSSLPLHCLSCPMLTWIFILLSEILSGNLIYRVSFSKLAYGSFSTSPFLLFWFQGVALALQLSASSSQKLSVSQIPFLSYDIKGIWCLLPTPSFQNLFS